MRWAVHDRWVTFYEVGEEMLDEQLVKAAARLMSWLSVGGGRECPFHSAGAPPSAKIRDDEEGVVLQGKAFRQLSELDGLPDLSFLKIALAR
jgi:hypothetical protein